MAKKMIETIGNDWKSFRYRRDYSIINSLLPIKTDQLWYVESAAKQNDRSISMPVDGICLAWVGLYTATDIIVTLYL